MGSGRERRDVSVSGLPASGKMFVRPKEGLDVDRSITPRWTSIDGITLSEKMGMFSVRGIGKGGGVIEPNRRVMVWSVKSAFLKQYTAKQKMLS